MQVSRELESSWKCSVQNKGTSYTVRAWTLSASAQLSTAARIIYLIRNNGHFCGTRRCCWANYPVIEGSWQAWPGSSLLAAWHASGSCWGASGHRAGGQSVGAPADGALGWYTEAVGRAITAIGCDVNKPLKSSLHSEELKIWKSDCWFLDITQNNKYWQKKFNISSTTWFSLNKSQ